MMHVFLRSVYYGIETRRRVLLQAFDETRMGVEIIWDYDEISSLRRRLRRLFLASGAAY